MTSGPVLSLDSSIVRQVGAFFFILNKIPLCIRNAFSLLLQFSSYHEKNSNKYEYICDFVLSLGEAEAFCSCNCVFSFSVKTQY